MNKHQCANTSKILTEFTSEVYGAGCHALLQFKSWGWKLPKSASFSSFSSKVIMAM